MRLEHAVSATPVIRLEGVFDGVAARKVEAMLADAAAGALVEVDLTHVREFHDFGIAVLAQALTRSRARVTLRGLCQRQIRVLEYFGIDARSLERAVSGDAS